MYSTGILSNIYIGLPYIGKRGNEFYIIQCQKGAAGHNTWGLEFLYPWGSGLYRDCLAKLEMHKSSINYKPLVKTAYSKYLKNFKLSF
jgi:hypothetical protein